MNRFPPLDLDRVKGYSLEDRPSKVSSRNFGRPWTKGGRLAEYLKCLPQILAAGDFLEVVDRLAEAVRNRRTVVLGMGGHPIKVGLSPIIIDLMARGVISVLAVNGSAMVHDTEVALIGATSEDVAATIGTGGFGMAREANELINAAAVEAGSSGLGLGRALGWAIKAANPQYLGASLFAAGVTYDLPVTVHVALGTDVYHLSPQADGAAIGQASLTDFRTFCAAVATLAGGIYINLGSAVILPEVFLKAVTLVRNLGYNLDDMTTVNMDFIRHYRPQVNVVSRPTAGKGRGFNLIGHHEIMLPFLAAALIEKLD